MTDKSFTKPNVVQDFHLQIAPEDIKHWDLTSPAEQFLEREIVAAVYRFLPQISAGKAININIRMESELR